MISSNPARAGPSGPSAGDDGFARRPRDWPAIGLNRHDRQPRHRSWQLGTNPLASDQILDNVPRVSTVELAVRKVKKLSARQARELLGWLSARQPSATHLKEPSRTSRRKVTARRSMQKLKAWQDSVRFTTDWQPPRMPDDLVKSVPL